MPPRDPILWMWTEACQHLDRAERLHRRFFEPGRSAAYAWEPPVDVFETEDRLIIEVALPGVDTNDVLVAIGHGELVVSGERRLPAAARAAAIRRLELPYGRFECAIPLPPGRYELGQRELARGCLLLVLDKVG